jgi:hypothetical protein
MSGRSTVAGGEIDGALESDEFRAKLQASPACDLGMFLNFCEPEFPYFFG